MPSRTQLIRKAEEAERNAADREAQAAVIDVQGYYWHYDGGDFAEDAGYHPAQLVKTTTQFVYIKQFAREYEKSWRCRKSDFEARGYCFYGRGTGVSRFWSGVAVHKELTEAAGAYRRQAASLRLQAEATPAHVPPDPHSESTIWLTMYYAKRYEDQHGARISFNKAVETAWTREDFTDLAEIASAHGDFFDLNRRGEEYVLHGLVNHYIVYFDDGAFHVRIEDQTQAILDDFAFATAGDAIHAAMHYDDAALASIDFEPTCSINWQREGF